MELVSVIRNSSSIFAFDASFPNKSQRISFMLLVWVSSSTNCRISLSITSVGTSSISDSSTFFGAPSLPSVPSEKGTTLVPISLSSESKNRIFTSPSSTKISTLACQSDLWTNFIFLTQGDNSNRMNSSGIY